MNKHVLRHNLSMLNADYVKLDTKWNYNNVISPYHRIYYIDEGEGEISSAGLTLKLEPGYLYIIPSFTLCNLCCRSYLSQYFVQFFEEASDGTSLFLNIRLINKVKATDIDVLNFKRLLVINPGRGINRSDNPRVYEKVPYYKEYQKLNSYQSLSDFLETQGILLMLLSRFVIPGKTFVGEPEAIPVKIMDTMKYILVNLHLTLSVNMLAKRVNQNPEYFSRSFERYTGIRPLTYINDKRIERAQHIMATSQVSNAEIAELTGFKSLSQFSRIFKKVTKISPRNYRQQIAKKQMDTRDI
ncbi:helix-turn-helix domain-containing protein [Chitinophaga tropicalis]|uniref:Helix-turn-helix domain-containing protein n=1 Tax=Chitinophaga tropicalis TaxID=2683588 RepID=A0A7K1U7N8_9BACT|nr:AraC family transcriptional regulator [Chitinophaga tropicalis]MVT10360.1 helix-turn-helix domain-containing protein [Chitinophaga tropicalis]